MNKLYLFIIFSFGFFVAIESAHAYPEMIRHGYPNCTSCHISPTGGGVLSTYGRELSKEVLSTWSNEGENRFLYFVKNYENIHFGGDLRTIEIYQDTPAVREWKFIWMQIDAEAGYTYKKLTAIGTIGYNTNALNKNQSAGLLSRRHYLTYQATDEISLRAGRFHPAFGINLPDHVLSIKRGLRLGDEANESYAVEAAYLGENYNFYATSFFSQPDQPETISESGISLQAAINLPINLKTGLSYHRGKSKKSTRDLFGPFVIYGITPKLFYLGEFDIKSELLSQALNSTNGYSTYQKMGYEWIQGLITFFSFDRYRNIWSGASGAYDSFGGGIQFFPRPHFELNLGYQSQYQLSNDSTSQIASFMFHYYL